MDELNLVGQSILNRIKEVLPDLNTLDVDQRINTINAIRMEIHKHSPFKDEPVDCILWVRADQVKGNSYNPNTVASPEMRLLTHSIDVDHYTQNIVGHQDGDEIEVVDGFHRTRVGKENKRIRERMHGHLPVALIKNDRGERKDRMAATIRHNRARGVHGVMPMTAIVAELHKRGWPDDKIAKELGMDADEVLRFKHNSGLPELFKDHEYSKAWE